MNVAFKQRSWLENMGLVFLLCYRKFVPLLLVSILLETPILAFQYWRFSGSSLDANAFGLFGLGYFTDSWFLDLLIRPIKQALSLYIVVRCYEGVRVPLAGGMRHALRYVPSVLVYSLIATVGLYLILIPGCFVALFTFNPFMLFIAGMAPLAWLFTGLALGPSSIRSAIVTNPDNSGVDRS